ncbi:MAG: putative 7-carboxy-7-deazaguanine synthase QueE [Clostridiales bacterium]|nr:putative 7-carboxy-7-deazaguanine synthase QueE [Clostridiales bacterium]
MSKFEVVEKFISVNGEGNKAGQLSVFIRFKGCNLNCDYCDTKWANVHNAAYNEMNEFEIYKYIKDTGIKNVTLTGGEPLFRENIQVLLKLLGVDENINVEIETNGSIDIEEFMEVCENIRFTMDYKLPSSGMENKMNLHNLEIIRKEDTVKFVVGSEADLSRAKEIIDEYSLAGRCHIYLSPVFGRIEPVKIVNFMKDNMMNDVNLQIQLHKIIWEPDKIGV